MIHKQKPTKRLWCYECKTWVQGLGKEMKRHQMSVIHKRNKESNLEFQNKTARSRNQDDEFYKRLYQLKDQYASG